MNNKNITQKKDLFKKDSTITIHGLDNTKVKGRINIGIIILTYNSQKYIKRCLDSLIVETKKLIDKFNITVHLVDNFSQDETVNIIGGYQFTTRFNETNIGFSKAINFVLKSTDYDYYLLLNPDTEILPNAISNLVNCSVKNKASIVGGKHFKMNQEGVHGTVVTIPNLAVMIFDYTNFRKMIPFDLVHKYHYYHGKLSASIPKIVGGVSGGFMLIKGELFKKIGYLDENYFMYLEDVDLCVRASEADEKVIYCPRSQIKHFGGGSTKNRYRTNLEAWKTSRRYYAKKHFSGLNYILIHFAIIVDEYLINLFTR